MHVAAVGAGRQVCTSNNFYKPMGRAEKGEMRRGRVGVSRRRRLFRNGTQSPEAYPGEGGDSDVNPSHRPGSQATCTASEAHWEPKGGFVIAPVAQQNQPMP